MKKTLLLFAVGLFLISCESSVPEILDTKQVINLVVEENQWIEKKDFDNINRYYSSSFKMPEIGSQVYNKGVVIAYLDNYDYQLILPNVRHYENLQGVRWTETIDYEYSNGSITFFVTSSDFFENPPAKMYFRVVLMW